MVGYVSGGDKACDPRNICLLEDGIDIADLPNQAILDSVLQYELDVTRLDSMYDELVYLNSMMEDELVEAGIVTATPIGDPNLPSLAPSPLGGTVGLTVPERFFTALDARSSSYTYEWLVGDTGGDKACDPRNICLS